MAFTIVPVDKTIARSAGLIRRQFGRSHGVGLADALIAATAQAAVSVLVTFNLRHFPMVEAKRAPY
jgi:predicted nucleic acid-binding protein